MTSIDTTIERLLHAHGSEGLAHSREDWRAILDAGNGPLRVLNLLKFRDEVRTKNGVVSGAQAYRQYARKNAKAFARAGAESLLFGPVSIQTGLGATRDWDAVVLSVYPTPLALADMWLDPEYIAAHEDRIAALERSQTLFLATE